MDAASDVPAGDEPPPRRAPRLPRGAGTATIRRLGQTHVLALDIGQRAADSARRQAVLLLPALATVIFLNANRERFFNLDVPVRLGAVLVLVLLGWQFARAVGGAFAPVLRRFEPGTAATAEFLVRLGVLAGVLLLAVWVAGVQVGTIAAGGAIAAVVLGLAAQQSIGNVIAGLLLLSARPFRRGELVRLQNGAFGSVEGMVTAQGLFYTVFLRGQDRVLVPNAQVITSVVMPFYEVGQVKVRVALRSDVKPSEVRALFDAMATPIREAPSMDLEEVTASATIVTITLAPASATDSRRLTDEMFSLLARFVHAEDGDTRSAGSGDGGDTGRVVPG